MEKPAVSTLKYDWYQTDSNVILNVLVKQTKPENVRIDSVDRQFTCSVKLSDSEDASLALNLAHSVQSNQTQFKVLSSKIEIKLKKAEELRWETLERKNKEECSDTVKLYPSSKPGKKDWDKIAYEIKKAEEVEETEGEEALNKMFQKIYSEGTDETKKAMNKSFMESGGTVLSTSWNEIAKQKTEVKPPDGTEYKTWDS